MVSTNVVMAVRVWIWFSTLATIYMPSRFVRRIYSERAVGSASIDPILVVLANSHVWMLYGYLGRVWFPSFPVFFIGDVVSLCYLFIYWRYSEQRHAVAKTIGFMFSWLVVATFYVIVASLGLTGQSRPEIWKTHGLCFCDVTVISIHTPMLKKLVQVFKQQSVALIDTRALAVTTVNTLGWFTYGQVTFNWIIAGPQVFVIALHVAAWTMYVVFTRRRTLEIDYAAMEEDPIALSVNLSPKIDACTKEGVISYTPEYQSLRSPVALT